MFNNNNNNIWLILTARPPLPFHCYEPEFDAIEGIALVVDYEQNGNGIRFLIEWESKERVKFEKFNPNFLPFFYRSPCFVPPNIVEEIWTFYRSIFSKKVTLIGHVLQRIPLDTCEKMNNFFGPY